MLKSALGEHVKKTNIEILSWKNGVFNFLKFKICYFQCKVSIFCIATH
jgi:hypothetical protein